ncbi:MAG: OmpH family outer membrane protein [Bacteroidetes bacterium]|nr:OmpH family outer membrane protein [Bacteroidota bacterium]
MKRFSVLFFALFLSLTSPGQTLKFGHIDSQALLTSMPERKKIEEDLNKYAQQLDGQHKAMKTEYENKVRDYQAQETLMTDPIKKTKLQEIDDLANRIGDFQMTAQESLQKKESELLNPILEKAKKAIADVAKENGYSYIFDTSVGVVLYHPQTDDILALVKKKLGIN